MSWRVLLAVVAPLLAGCFVDDGVDDGPVTSGASSSGAADETSVTSTGEDPTTDVPPTPRCGDAIQDPDEQCDLGEQSNGVDGAFCREDCTTNLCGDGYLASNEGCDDGNSDPGDGCSASCKLDTCGDGSVSSLEECDDGNAVDSDECTNLCMHAACGDGIVQDGVEACDVGDPRSADGCTAECQLQVCGDGKLDRGEQCDDGNATDLDGCSAACVTDARRVFATSGRYSGGFGGLAGADAICQGLARAAGLSGIYRAWLSDAAVSAAMRLEPSLVPYILVDGTVVAGNWLDLTDGALTHPINVDEHGVTITGEGCKGGNLAWTNTKLDGADFGGVHCGNWQQVAPFDGRGGELNVIGTGWTDSCTMPCTALLHLYCFEQGA